MVTATETLKLGVEAHKVGKLAEADRYYRAVLKEQPNHPDANHNMGVLLVGAGQTTVALSYFKRALEANSRVTQFWLSILNALIALNRYSDVKRILLQAKEVGVYGPDFVEIENKIKLHELNDTSCSMEGIEKLKLEGKYSEALRLLKPLVSSEPNNVELNLLMSHCYMMLDDVEKAEIYHNSASRLTSTSKQCLINEVKLSLKKRKFMEAQMLSENLQS